jgi:hypothetical protein
MKTLMKSLPKQCVDVKCIELNEDKSSITGFCDYNDEHWGYIREFLDQLYNYRLW